MIPPPTITTRACCGRVFGTAVASLRRGNRCGGAARMGRADLADPLSEPILPRRWTQARIAACPHHRVDIIHRVQSLFSPKAGSREPVKKVWSGESGTSAQRATSLSLPTVPSATATPNREALTTRGEDYADYQNGWLRQPISFRSSEIRSVLCTNALRTKHRSAVPHIRSAQRRRQRQCCHALSRDQKR